MNPLIQLKQTTSVFLVAFAIACFRLLSTVQAVVPAPDGGYPGGNTAEGQNALFSLTTGRFNTAVGVLSLHSDTTNNFNTAVGAGTLVLNTGNSNTAVGAAALLLNTTGTDNTAIGTDALVHNTTGEDNTASGFEALFSNTTGFDNTAIGFEALFSNTTAEDNVAIGNLALTANTTGFDNTAIGNLALTANTTANHNTAIGNVSLAANTVGGDNTAAGNFALAATTTGNGNVAVGSDAGDAIVDGSNDVAIGRMAGTTFVHATNSIAIGAPGAGPFADAANTCFIGSIHGQVVSDVGSAQPVFVDQFNVMGIVPSSRRFKHDVQPMNKASEALLALKPVTFKYNIDKKGTTQYGLIAEEVAEVNPDLVSRDKEAEISSVRYDQVNAMLLNEFLKEHKKVEAQQATISDLKSTVAQQRKGFESKLAKQERQIESLTAGLQKVSAQLQVSKAAPQSVVNNR